MLIASHVPGSSIMLDRQGSLGTTNIPRVAFFTLFAQGVPGTT